MSLLSLAKEGNLGEEAVGLARIFSPSCKPDLTQKGEVGDGAGDLALLGFIPDACGFRVLCGLYLT